MQAVLRACHLASCTLPCSRLLLQIGSFVPADFAAFRPVDRLFTRIGMSDSIETNSSTFMVEMTVCSRPSRVMQRWQMHVVLMWKETCAGDCIHCEACYRAEPGDHGRARARHVHSRCGHVFKLQPPLFPDVKETPNTAFM